MGKLRNFMATKLLQVKTTENIDKIFTNENVETIKVGSESSIPTELEKYMNIHEVDGKVEINAIKEKIYHIERSFLYEQNSIVEKIEQEKFDIIENFRNEKKLLKKKHEREKLELLKEIERKDKILFHLKNIFQEEQDMKSKQNKTDLLTLMESKISAINTIEDKLKVFMKNLQTTVENNRDTLNGLHEFDDLKHEYETLSSIQISQTELSLEVKAKSKDDKYSKDVTLKLNRLINSNKNSTNQCACESAVVRLGNVVDETSIQHELAQAYRKQKSELLRLFNEEKNEFEKTISKKKVVFEKEVRTEYETRMIIERKAWQDTIEDYEREIAILKFEREQMDRNYCIGMDELKTEFEREKRSLHRSYSETHAELKRTLINKTRTESLKENKEKSRDKKTTTPIRLISGDI